MPPGPFYPNGTAGRISMTGCPDAPNTVYNLPFPRAALDGTDFKVGANTANLQSDWLSAVLVAGLHPIRDRLVLTRFVCARRLGNSTGWGST